MNVIPGKYDITITRHGFNTAQITGETVSVGTQTTANVKLQVGGSSQTVEVEASGIQLQTLNSTIGMTISPAAINALPTLGRDATTFATLQPGVSPEGSVGGTVVDQTMVLLDGGNNSNDMDGSMNVYTSSFAGDPTGIVGSAASGEGMTVIRGGYGRIYGRLNGVDLVLTPLLGTGLIQPVQCRLALSNGACGPTTPTDSTAFRIGVDGDTAPLPAASATLPQPLYPGYNNVSLLPPARCSTHTSARTMWIRSISPFSARSRRRSCWKLATSGA